MTVLAVRLSDKVVFVPEKWILLLLSTEYCYCQRALFLNLHRSVFLLILAHWLSCACGDICVKWYYVVTYTFFCNTLKLKYPVSGAKSMISFIWEQMNTNLSMFYCFGCCMYHSCMEMKCLVSGAKKLMLFNRFWK